MQSIKEHNLKANHNCLKCKQSRPCSVCNLSKNTIWKQITTVSFHLFHKAVLYAIYQRTQSESKSQRTLTSWNPTKSVCNLSKNTIWKQITTRSLWFLSRPDLYAIYQRTQSESKSQQQGAPPPVAIICMQSIKEHNLKANHNSMDERQQGGTVCMQSIKEHNLKANHNESDRDPLVKFSVCNLSKNTIWKQITTVSRCRIWINLCMQSIKEHNLKANHNHSSV